MFADKEAVFNIIEFDRTEKTGEYRDKDRIDRVGVGERERGYFKYSDDRIDIDEMIKQGGISGNYYANNDNFNIHSNKSQLNLSNLKLSNTSNSNNNLIQLTPIIDNQLTFEIDSKRKVKFVTGGFSYFNNNNQDKSFLKVYKTLFK